MAIRTTAILNLKGGVAKTTTTVNMAAILAKHYGKRVLVIDADSQCNTSVTADNALREIAASMGVSVEPATLALMRDVTITGGLAHLPDTATNSAVLGYVAGLVGGNAIIDRSGLVSIRQMCYTNFETEPYEGGATAKGEVFSISGISLQRTCATDDEAEIYEQEFLQEFLAGDGSLLIENPLADQAAADQAWAALKNISFMPGNYSFPGGILLEPGDLFMMYTMDGSYSVAAVTVSMSFDGGVKSDVSCGGTVSAGGAHGSVNQALKTLTADLARLRTLVAENAQIVNAKISNLSVEDITAGRIHSTDFAVIPLEKIYPSDTLFPASDIYPNNGDQITRGFEIDFAEGVIRGAFWSESVAKIDERLTAIETRLSQIESK